MNYEQKIKNLKEILREAKEKNLSAEETFLEVTQLIPPKEVLIEKKPKSSEERLEYLKRYRLMQKELERLKAERHSKEMYKQKKIEKALKRTGFHCYKCMIPVKVDPKSNKYKIESKNNAKKEKIIIINTCEECGGKIRAFGGYL